MKINDIGEFGLIKRIRDGLSLKDLSVLKGIGDDCAVVRIPDGNICLLSTDSLIEKVHFDLNYTSGYYLGKKTAAISISDIAAMGGRPKYLLISLAIPDGTDLSFIDELYRGIEETSEEFGLSIVGGNTSRSPSHIVIDSFVTGYTKEQNLIYRHTARIGDKIFVTGEIGDSVLGLNILKKKREEEPDLFPEFERLVLRHLSPSPRAREGYLIGERQLASAMIDISDGLLHDLNQVAKESHVGARIYQERVPVSDSYRSYVSRFNLDLWESALCGGEDYELLFTVGTDKIKPLMELSKKEGFKTSHIGEIVKEEEGVRVFSENGELIPFAIKGYNHFA